MDSIISSALEEICGNQGGLNLSSLWLKLKIELSPSGLKQSIWTNLRNVPTIELRVKNNIYTPTNPSIQCFKDAEQLDLRIVPMQTLRDNFLGIYDTHLADSKVSSEQRRTLERIAASRTKGITQNQLSDELGADKKKLWYDMKKLESSGLIVRQKADEKSKAYTEGESQYNVNVHTNLLHLYRYARYLGSHQTFQIIKEEQLTDDFESTGKDNLSVNDYQLEMKAICDKLEQANGKVLVVLDIKHELGYVGGGMRTKRRWRSLSERMTKENLVEFFKAEVNGKVVLCLRLLKKYSPKKFDPKSVVEDRGNAQIVKFGRQQNNNQSVELSIEHQIYDAIDSTKSEGITSIEVGKMLGFDTKTNGRRLYNIIKRFGMHLRREMHKRTEVYRIWTADNFNPESANLFASVSKKLFSESPNQDVLTDGKGNGKGTDSELFYGFGSNSNQSMLRSPETLPESLQEPRGESPVAKLDFVSTPSAKSTDTSATRKPQSTMSLKPTPCPEDQSPLLTADNVQRDQRILERIQKEKFVLKIELYRWLVNLEKDKGTKMDRRTLKRSIHRLEQNGHCKYVAINLPVTKYSKSTSSAVDVVLHPSVESSSPELILAVEDKFKSFRRDYQKPTLSPLKDDESVPVLDGVERSQRAKKHEDANAISTRVEFMRANGFVVGKMIRAKLLHSFLWNHLRSSPGWMDAQNLLDIDAAIRNIPLELFLKVVGSTRMVDNMLEKCEKGLLLCDLPAQEEKHLKDTHATNRLSLIINILQWLKLIRLVTSGHSEDGAKIPKATSVYALELDVYVEEPQLIKGIYSTADLLPKVRHNFVLSSINAVDEYWKTLEYCFATADPKAASKAFPGSVVRKVFCHRSWGSLQSMTAELNADLLMRVPRMVDPALRLPFEECKKIAKELNVTLAQVLLAYVYKNRKRKKKLLADLNNNGEARKHGSSRKRKISSEAKSVKCRRVDNENENAESSKQILLGSTNMSDKFLEEKDMSSTSPTKHGNLSEVNDHQTAEEVGLNETHEPTRKRKRKQRFLWTAEADRKMIIQYVRYRVVLGAKFHRVFWDSIKDLPASPSICQRRISSLKQYKEFRIALMRFCNLLSKRYEKQLERRQKSVHDDDLGLNSSVTDFTRNIFHDIENAQYDRWDDFNEKEIKEAFQVVLQCKQIAIVEAYKRAVCVSESQFPTNTEKHAARFLSWLHERQGDLKKTGVNLPENLHCGDVFHLFGLLSLGKLSIFTRLPGEGVGEAEGAIDDEYFDGRREKGFPGIQLSVHYVPQPHSISVQEDNVVQKESNDVSREFKLYSAEKAIDKSVYKKLRNRVFGTIMQNPGILEDDIICSMKTVNPESCRMLLNKMVEENLLTVRKMDQTTSNAVPNILTNLVKSNSGQQKTMCRKHFFANPMKISSL